MTKLPIKPSMVSAIERRLPHDRDKLMAGVSVARNKLNWHRSPAREMYKTIERIGFQHQLRSDNPDNSNLTKGDEVQ